MAKETKLNIVVDDGIELNTVDAPDDNKLAEMFDRVTAERELDTPDEEELDTSKNDGVDDEEESDEVDSIDKELDNLDEKEEEEKEPSDKDDKYEALLEALKEQKLEAQRDREELKALRESLKPKDEVIQKVSKVEKAKIKADKLAESFDKLGNGDIDEAKELIKELFAEDNSIDEEDIKSLIEKESSLKARELFTQYAQEEKQRKDMEFVDNFYLKNDKNLKDLTFSAVMNAEITKVKSTKEGSALPVEGLLNKAYERACKLLNKQVPQSASNSSDTERQAKMNKAKLASVKQSATGKVPAPVESEEDENESLVAHFMKQVRSR